MSRRNQNTRFAAKEDSSRWYFALAAVADDKVMATGVFTGTRPSAFFSKRAINSLKGKLLALRDRHLPGKRMVSVTIIPHGETTGIVLSLDNLVADFATKVPFRRNALYHACLMTETACLGSDSTGAAAAPENDQMVE